MQLDLTDGAKAAAPPVVPFLDLRASAAEVWPEVRERLAAVVDRAAFIDGAEVGAFEAEWAAYCGRTWCVGVANGTDALELSLRAAGVGPGDEVLVPANSFNATAGAIVRAGARPAFVDVDPTTLLLDADQVLERVAPRTRAVIPVHLFGQLAPVASLAGPLAARGVVMIEDAAQAHGATQARATVGTHALAATFSFYPGKNLGAFGDAGAVVTDDAGFAAQVRALGHHGSRERYRHDTLGFNSRLDTLQAVALRAKLTRLDTWNAARRRAAARYDELLSTVGGVTRVGTAATNDHVWHLYVIRVPERDHLLESLRRLGIEAAVHYPVPLHLQPAFAACGYRRGSCPVAEQAADEILSLPLSPHITFAQQEQVVDALRAALVPAGGPRAMARGPRALTPGRLAASGA